MLLTSNIPHWTFCSFHKIYRIGYYYIEAIARYFLFFIQVSFGRIELQIQIFELKIESHSLPNIAEQLSSYDRDVLASNSGLSQMSLPQPPPTTTTPPTLPLIALY